jgi:hypothetical protein
MLQTLKEARLPRSYAPEFRLKVLDLVAAGRPKVYEQTSDAAGLNTPMQSTGHVAGDAVLAARALSAAAGSGVPERVGQVPGRPCSACRGFTTVVPVVVDAATLPRRRSAASEGEPGSAV